MSEWKQYRIKDISSLVGSGTTPKSTVEAYYEGGTHEWVNTGDLNDDIVLESSTKITDLAIQETSLRYYPEGTVIEAMYGATIGKVGMLSQPSTVNQACCAIVPQRTKINGKLLLYYLKNYKPELLKESFGGTQPNVNQHDVVTIPMNLPSLPEQDRIVAYLDKKTAAIDTQVSLLEQKAKKYEQLKKSLISCTVTRGLNKDARLKESGIDWIGQIPEHWEVKRGKDLLKITNGFPADSNLFDTDGNGIPLIRIRDISSATTEVTYVGVDYTEEFLINHGDLLIGMDGDFNSANWRGDTALLNQRVCKIESKKIERRYLSYIVTFPLLEINAKKVLTTVKHLASSDLYETSLPIPPLSEQQAIADYLDKKTAEIDAAIANINQQIEKYKLLRRALINEVVTGQRAI